MRSGAAVAAGGPVVLDPDVARPRWLDEGLSGYLTSFSLGEQPRTVRPEEFLLTANLAVARSALTAVGGFDAGFGPRGGMHLVADDVRLVRQLQRAGGTISYVPGRGGGARAAPGAAAPPLPAASRLPAGAVRLDPRAARPCRPPGRGAARRGDVVDAWLRHELRARRREGLSRPAARFHLGCDLVRYAGTLREAAAGVSRRRGASTGGEAA